MSTAAEIHVARHIGTDPEARKAEIAGMVAELDAGARAAGWLGMKFSTWASVDGNVWIAVKEGEGWDGIDELRAFRMTMKGGEVVTQQQGALAL